MGMRIVYASPDVMRKREEKENTRDVMGAVYASPDVMGEREEKEIARGKWMYPLSHLDDAESEREQQLLTNTIYNAPDFTAEMNQKLEEEGLGMECVYASPERMEQTEPVLENTERIEPAPEKKRGLLSRLFGGKKK